jgi:large repetitive protein
MAGTSRVAGRGRRRCLTLNRRWAKAGVATVAVAAAVLAMAPAAFADTVTNNVTVGGNDTTTVGASTTVSYTITANGGVNDTQNGCNAGDPNAKNGDKTPAVVTINAGGATANPGSLTFTDCVTKNVQFSAAQAGTYQVTISVSDAGGGTYTTSGATFTLHVTAPADTNGPVLSLPSDQTVEATSRSGAVLSYSATAFDAGDNKATAVTCNPTSGSTFPIGTTTVNCSSSDSKGNRSASSFKVTVADTTGPVLSLSDTTAEASSGSGAKVSFSATAVDAVDGSTAVSCTPASGSQFALGTTTVSCSSTDSHGNKSTGSLKVTVQDTTAPSLTLPTTTVAEATSGSGADVSYTASANDLVDGTVPVSCNTPSGSTFSLGDTAVTCSATDAHGNRATGSFTVTVGDHTAPTLDLTNKTAEATAPDGADVTYSATANDAVDGAITPQCEPGSGTTFAVGTTTVDCSASDSRGNTAMGTLKITVQDTSPPSLTLADETDEATSANGASVSYTASAKDLVSGDVPVTCDHASGSTFPLGATVVTCSATDSTGNKATGSFAVAVKDRTAPVLFLSNQTQEATSASGAPVPYDTKATDLVDGTDPVTCDKPSGARFPLGITTVTCSATDKAGNKATDTFTVTVVDTTPPSISAPDTSAEATGPDGATVSFSATATDLVDGAVPVTCGRPSGDLFPLGDTSFSCRAEDSRGNFSTTSVTISVVDTTPPEVKTTDMTAEATGPNGATVAFTASATDLVDGTVKTSCTPASASTFSIGKTTVSCTATDSHGNTGTASATVTVQDTTGPALTLANQTLEATGANGSPATFNPTATDLVSGDRPVTCDHSSGDTFAIGDTTVTCSAADSAGNESEGSFTITVGDHTAPLLTLQDAQAEATQPTGANVSYNASATDIVDGPRPIDCNPASGSTFPIAVTTVNCSAADTRGNTATGSLTVTVTDNTPPSLTLTDQQAEATGASGATVTYPAAANDIVDGAVSVSCDKTSGATFPIGTTTVHCSATDAHGNKATGSFTVTVTDTTAPKLSLPGNLSREATAANGATVTYSAIANDTVDGAVTPSCTPNSGSTFKLGTTMVTCSAADKAGNSTSDSFAVTVTDTTAPILSVKDITDEATSAAGAAVIYTTTATDLVDGNTTVTCTIPSGSTFKIGDTLVTCTTADKAGNKASADFTVTVQDTKAPVLPNLPNINLTATSAAGAIATYTPTAADAVDGTDTATCSPVSGSTFALGTTQVSCTATDKAKNTSTAQVFNVKVTVPWSNVLAPLNSDGSSVYKTGSTIPVKFQLTGSASAIGNLPAKLYYAKFTNNALGSEVEATSTSAADSGNQFRYDSTAKQYIFNLSTKGFTTGTYQLSIDLGDGVAHTVTIAATK